MVYISSWRFCALKFLVLLEGLWAASAWPKDSYSRSSPFVTSSKIFGSQPTSIEDRPQDETLDTSIFLVATSLTSILPKSSLAGPYAVGLSSFTTPHGSETITPSFLPPGTVVNGIPSTITPVSQVNGKDTANSQPVKRSVAVVTETLTEIDWVPVIPSASSNDKGVFLSTSATPSLPTTTPVVSSAPLPIDPDATTTVFYDRTVIIVPPGRTSAFPQISFSPSSTSKSLRPTDIIATNGTHYPSHDKVKKIAEIVVPSVVGGVLGGGTIYKIGKWTWQTIDNLQRLSNQPYSTDQLVRMMINVHEEEELRRYDGQTQQQAEAEEQSVAETESYLMESEAESPGLVLTEEAKAAIQRVLGQHACTLQGSQFAPYPPGYEPWSAGSSPGSVSPGGGTTPGSGTPPNGPDVPNGEPPSSGGSSPGSHSPPNAPPGPENPPASPPSGPESSSGSDNPPAGPRIPGLPPIPWLNPPSRPGHSGPDAPEGPGKGPTPPKGPDIESSLSPSSTLQSVIKSSPTSKWASSKSIPNVSSSSVLGSSSSSGSGTPALLTSLTPNLPPPIAISNFLPASLAPPSSTSPTATPQPSLTFYTLSESIPVSSSSSASPTPPLTSSPARSTTLHTSPSPSPPPKPSPGLKKPACRHKYWHNCCIYEGGLPDGLRYCFA